MMGWQSGRTAVAVSVAVAVSHLWGISVLAAPVEDLSIDDDPEVAIEAMAQHQWEKEELEELSLRELSILRNAPFARAGLEFETPWLYGYFSRWPDYDPQESPDEITDREDANASLIREVEEEFSTQAIRKRWDEVWEEHPDLKPPTKRDTWPSPGPWEGLDGRIEARLAGERLEQPFPRDPLFGDDEDRYRQRNIDVRQRAAELIAAHAELGIRQCPSDDGLQRLSHAWNHIEDSPMGGPFYREFARLTRRIEACRDAVVDGKLEAVDDEDAAVAEVADKLERDKEWFVDPLVHVDFHTPVNTYCAETNCVCPGTPGTAAIDEIEDHARLVYLTDPDRPEVVVGVMGCARRHGPSMVILVRDGAADRGWSMFDQSYEGMVKLCDVHEVGWGREAMACHGGLMHQGWQETISSVVAGFEGDIEKKGVESVTYLAGNCFVHDSRLVQEKIRSTTVFRDLRGQLVAEIKVPRLTFDVPEEYDGNVCEAEEDGHDVPDPSDLQKVEPESRIYVYDDGEFRRTVPAPWMVPDER